jgi:hypothetical protein
VTATSKLDDLMTWAEGSLEQALERRRLGDALAAAGDAVDDSQSALEALATLSSLARSLQAELSGWVRDRARTIGNSLRATAGQIAAAEGRDDFQKLAHTVPQGVLQAERDLRAALAAEWTRLCEEDLEAQQARARAIAKVGALAPLRARVRDYDSLVQRTIRAFPPPDPIAALDGLRQARAELERAFDSSGLRPPVLAFLREAASGRARLDDAMAPEVRTWLKSNGVWDNLRINLPG